MNPMSIFAAVQGVLGAVDGAKAQNSTTTNADQDARLSFAQMMSSLQNMPGIGQNQPGAQDDTLSAIDRAARRTALFKQMDANGDGQLSKEELKSFQEQKVQEAKNALLQLQEAMNGNSSNATGKKQKKTPIQELLDAITSNAQQSQKPQHKGHHGHGKHGIDHLFSRLDTDGNGQLSLAEFVNRGQTPAATGTTTAEAVTPAAIPSGVSNG